MLSKGDDNIELLYIIYIYIKLMVKKNIILGQKTHFLNRIVQEEATINKPSILIQS